MNLQKIDKNKLPIKYILGIHKDLPAYPDAFDILYIFINENIKRPSKHGKNFTKHALLTYHCDKKHYNNATEGINRALQLGLIEPNIETKEKESYKIIINPFI